MRSVASPTDSIASPSSYAATAPLLSAAPLRGSYRGWQSASVRSIGTAVEHWQAPSAPARWEDVRDQMPPPYRFPDNSH